MVRWLVAFSVFRGVGVMVNSTAAKAGRQRVSATRSRTKFDGLRAGQPVSAIIRRGLSAACRTVAGRSRASSHEVGDVEFAWPSSGRWLSAGVKITGASGPITNLVCRIAMIEVPGRGRP